MKNAKRALSVILTMVMLFTAVPLAYVAMARTDPAEHNYEPRYVWAEDNSCVTAAMTCTVCGDTTITETVKATKKVTLEPTCTKNGEALYTSDGFACKAFYVQTKTEPIDALGHDPQIAPYVPPTCTEFGYAPFICTRCGEIISKTDPEDPLGHDYKPVYVWAEDNSTVTATLTCTRCSDTTITETVGVTKKVIAEPTCTDEGEAMYISGAFNCKSFYVQTKKEPIPSLGHDFEPVYVWAEDNSTVTATLTCTRCGATSITETVKATGKITVKPTCTHGGEVTYTSDPFACKAFYVQIKTEPIAPLPHDTVRIRQKSPTCTETGIDTYCVCNDCGRLFEDEAATIPLDEPPVLPKLPHKTVRIRQKSPTCTATGIDTYCICEVCGGLFEDEEATKPLEKPPVLPMLPHKLYEVPAVGPTCTEDGVVAHWRCEMCGQYFSDRKGTPAMFPLPKIPALGHTPGETVKENEIPATYESSGSYDEVVYCTECGAEISRNTVHISRLHRHTDRDNDGYCDQCDQMMTGGDHCPFCGKIHTGVFSKLIRFFHNIFALLSRRQEAI